MAQFILHVGTMKTGTTYLQSLLSQNKDFLASNAWLYPGSRFNQQHACYGICGSHIYWVKDNGSRFGAAGRKLVQEIDDWRSDIIVSAEALSALPEEGIKNFLARVGRPTKIVFTIRPLWLLIPSAWQQMIKAGHSVSLGRFIEDRFKSKWGDEAAPMVLTYAYGRAIRRWANVAEASVEVIESLPSGPGGAALWGTFRDMCGLPEVPNKNVPTLNENKSISKEAAKVLARVNVLLKDTPNAENLRKAYLSEVLFPLADRGVGTKPTLPPEYAEAVNAWDDEELAIAKAHSTVTTIGDPSKRKYVPDASAAGDSLVEVMAHQIVELLPHIKSGESARIA